ncbi:MAG: DUF3857 domain-containing protein [Bacteroidota bacterium]
MKTTITILAFLLTSTLAVSQNYKYGKVSKEELSETQNDLYPESEATVLFRKHKSYYQYRQDEGFTLYTEVYERIKIYNQEGFKWANQSFKTYNYGSNREKIENLKATTYNLEGGSIKKDKLTRSALFTERASNYYMRNKFTLPNIKEGSVIEFTYTISSPFTRIEDIDLQYTIPIRKEVVEVFVPEFFVYNNYGNPQAALNFNYEKGSEEISVDINARTGIGNANKGATAGGTSKYKENQYTLEESNIPPLKMENYVDNLNNYRAKSVWELSMTNWPNELPKVYSTNWEAVTESIYNRDAFANELNKTNYYSQDLAGVLADASDPLEKANRIFSFVKEKMTWDGYYGYFPNSGVKQAYKDGTGNSGDINLMLISMLRSANLNAHPVLVSSKDHGIPVFPTRYGFNYVIAGLEFNGNLYLMDATSDFAQMNLLPARAMNWQGRLIKPDGTSQWVGLYPQTVSQDITYAQAEIKGTEVSASIRERLTGHFAREYRTAYYDKQPDAQLEAMQPGEELALLSNLEVKDLISNKPFVSLSYEATSGTLVEEINEELYFSPMLFMAHLENPFKEESRDYPIYFGYPQTQKYNVTIKVPEGYKVSSLPESSAAKLSEGRGGYTYLIKEAPGMIQLSVVLELNSPVILSDDYTYVKGMFSEIAEKESEKIVLSKI